jgi:hypothetical protein
VPFDREEDFHFVATAYYLSPAVRTHWEKKLGGQIIWQATTMDIVADFLDRIQAERSDGKKNSGTRAPFGGSTPPMPVPGGSAAPGGSSVPSSGSAPIQFPSASGKKPATTH